MKKTLNGSKDPLKRSISTKGKRITLFKCPHCDVTSHSSPGLKGHITKKHTQFKQTKTDARGLNSVRNTLKETVKKNEVLDLVDYLLSEFIEISDDDECMKNNKINCLEEANDIDEANKGKTYSNQCDRCDFVVEGTKKYDA